MLQMGGSMRQSVRVFTKNDGYFLKTPLLNVMILY